MEIGEGWALRRNFSCILGEEVFCGPTSDPYFACCPSGLKCPKRTDNVTACCNSDTKCPENLDRIPGLRCSNTTWNLFDTGIRKFCCEPQYVGLSFNNGYSSGCRARGDGLIRDEIALNVFSAGVKSGPVSSMSHSSTSPSPFLSTSSSTSTSTSISTYAHSTNSSASRRAVIGGVVGGVIAVALIACLGWLKWRRKHTRLNRSEDSTGFGFNRGHELQADQGVVEVDSSSKKTQLAEVDDTSKNRLQENRLEMRVELPVNQY